MLPIWILFSVLAGILLSFSQPFQWGDIKLEPNWLSLLAASFGLALWMKVCSMRRNAWSRFLIGFLGAFTYFLISLYWIYIALREIGELSAWLSLLGCFALSAFCAAYFGLWAVVAGLGFVREKSVFARILIWASFFAFLGFARESLFSGFGWAEPATLFSYFPVIGRSAWFWGLHGLSFFWMFSLSILVHSDECLKEGQARFQTGTWAGVFLLVILLSNFLPQSYEDSERVKIALVQPNISQDMKWKPGEAQQNLTNLVLLTREAIKENPQLIVWPETSYPYPVFKNQLSFPINSNIPLVIGAVMKEGRINYNTAILIENNERKAFFAKKHLVPFGEYVPFEDYLPLEKLVENTGRFLPGENDQELLQLEELGLKLGSLICYEDIFVKHSVTHAKAGANLLLNLTNDGWYKKSSALLQHAAMAQMQVFSTGLPMVRATNTGLSSAMTFWKRRDYEMHQRGTFIVEVPAQKDPQSSFFVAAYPYIQWIWALLFVIGLLWMPSLSKRKIFFRN